jgi:SAM-dependent methyltransferase
MHVLEVACGSGHISHLAASLGAIASGVDFSAAMVAEARKYHPSLSFSVSDAESLPFPDGSFDAVVIGFGVNHFPSPQRAIAEVRRVLRKGGRFAFAVWSSSDNTFQQLLLNAIAESGVRGSSLPVPPKGDVKSLDTCMRLLPEAGFDPEKCSVRKLDAHLTITSGANLLEITEKGTAKGSTLIHAQPSELMPAVMASLVKRMDPYRERTTEAYAIPAVALLASAVLG